MSTVLPPNVDSSPPPSPPRESVRIGSILAWFVIVTCLGVVLTMRWHVRPTPTAPGNNAEQLSLRLAARYAVGAKTVLSELGQTQTAAQVNEMVRHVEQAATSPREQLLIIPVVAELLGADAAVQRLDQILPSFDSNVPEHLQILRTVYTKGSQELDERERTQLLEEGGWFGKLALSWQRPSTDPLRKAAMAPAVRTAVVALLAIIGLVLTMLAGIALLIVAIVFTSQGRLRGMYFPAPHGRGFFVEAFALYLAWFVGVGLVARFVRTSSGLISGWTFVAALAPLACLWPLARGMTFGELRRDLGWHSGRGWIIEIGTGVLGYIAGLPVIALGIAITFFLSRWTGARPSHPAVEMISSDPWKVLGLLALASVYAPIVEETMFRGALYGGIRRACGIVISALVVSFIFSAMHPQGWAGVPALMSIAIVFTMLREWRGSLLAPIAAHAINNGALILFLVLAAA